MTSSEERNSKGRIRGLARPGGGVEARTFNFSDAIYAEVWGELEQQSPKHAHEYLRLHKRRHRELFHSMAYYLSDLPSPTVLEVGVSGFLPLYKKLFPHIRLTTIDRPAEMNGVTAHYCVQQCQAERHYSFDLNKVLLSRELGTPSLGTFDYVLCTEVIEHLLVNPVELITGLLDLLDERGYLYLTTPNFLSHHRLHVVMQGRNPMPVYPRRGENQDHGHHFREYTMEELIGFVQDAGGLVVKASYSDCWDEGSVRQDLLGRYPEFSSNLVLVAARHAFDGFKQGPIAPSGVPHQMLPQAMDVVQLQAEIGRLRALVISYERGRFIRFMRWLRERQK